MNSVQRFSPWLAAAVAAIAIACLILPSQKAFAHDGRSNAIRSVATATQAPVARIADQPSGSGAIIMDGDWLYIVRGSRLYKVQKSTMSVFQTVDLQ